MKRKLRHIGAFFKALSLDTHLWCISVIGGAILLCTSFFVNPIDRFFSLNGNVVNAQENSIEVVHNQVNYSSVIGNYDIPEEVSSGVNTVEESVSICLDDGSAVSVEDFDALCRIIECEAKSEDIKGRILVANVILNRVACEEFPDTIQGVIESPGQFDPVTSKAYFVAVPSAETKEATMRALNGEDYSMGALYFQKSESEIWGTKEFVLRHDSHSFYK